MDIVLVDTSVWVNVLKKTDTLAAIYLMRRKDEISIATCPTVVQEVLQGVITDNNFASLLHSFNQLFQFQNNPYEIAIEAAQLYRSLRKKGITIRKPNDCLIAAYAIHHNVFVLHEDRDFVYIAKNSDLKIIKP